MAVHKGSVSCSAKAFGSDVLPDVKKECYCEHKKELGITAADKCAEEGA